jgi:hypothetical protein
MEKARARLIWAGSASELSILRRFAIDFSMVPLLLSLCELRSVAKQYLLLYSKNKWSQEEQA